MIYMEPVQCDQGWYDLAEFMQPQDHTSNNILNVIVHSAF